MSELSPTGFRARKLTKKELAKREAAFACAQKRIDENKIKEAEDPDNKSSLDIDTSVFGF